MNVVDFAQVFEALKQGKKVRRKRWMKDTTLSIDNGELVQHNPLWRSGTSTIQFDWSDINAKDWVILP